MLLLVGGALLAALNMTGAVVLDAALSTQQTQALYLAESGMARALKLYGQKDAICADLAKDGSHSFGGGSFTVVSAIEITEPEKQCRVRVTGSVGGASRTIEGDMRRSTNGFPPQANVDFNSPLGICIHPDCTPTNWTFTPAGNWWQDFGGSALSIPTNSRAAYVEKTSPGGGSSAHGGGYKFYPPITRAGGTKLTISFDYKNTVNGGAEKMSVDFTLYEANTLRSWSTSSQLTTFKDGNTPGWVTSGTRTSSVSPAYTYTAPASPTITLPSGPPIYINRIDFTLSAGAGMTYKTWIDNIKIDGENTGLTTEEKTVLLNWREVIH